MATTPTKPDVVASPLLGAGNMPAWPRGEGFDSDISAELSDFSTQEFASKKPSQRDALQALLAFSALHEQVRRRKSLAARHGGFDAGVLQAEFDGDEQLVLDEILQLVAERAIAITGADGLAIALAENNEIVLRASAGTVRPDVGARIDRDSAFSGVCFNSAQIVNCDDTELDPRVNLEACRKLGARSMVAVPLCGRRRVIGVLEAFSSWPFGFNDSDIRSLSLLAELVLGAMRPEDEDRFALSAEAAASKLASKGVAAVAPTKAATPPAVGTAVIAKPMEAAPQPTPAPPPSATAKPGSPAVVPVITPTVLTASVAVSKPVLQESKVAPAEAILEKPAAEPEKAVVVPEPAVAKTVTEPIISTGVAAPAETKQRPYMVVLLVCIVVVTAFAAGVWWKLKNSQLGSVMVKTETMEKGKVPTASGGANSTKESSLESVAPVNSPATAADASDAEAAVSVPATPQELSKFPRVTGIRHWSSSDVSTVVLDLEDQVQYEPGHLTNPDRVYFDLRDTQLVAELQGKSLEVGDSLLSRIRMAQPVSGMTRVVLEAKGGATLSRPQVSLERDPYRLVIQVTKAGTTPKAEVNLFPNAVEAEKSKLAIVIPPPTKEDLQLRTHVPKMRIVVDAGHGGWDLGTVGRRGLLEKDLVLEIAQRLGKLLESRLGSEVIYTRQDDNYIPLDERASIANTAQADLFVSVHANYSDLPSARGVETYYTNFFSAPGSKEPGPKIVNAQAIAAGKPLATPTLSPSELHERIEQSRRLAASVQRSLYGTLSVQNPGLRDRGIKEAGFVVLTESAMPGILAEVSFVSSPTDEQKLRSDGYREEIAEALYKGIARYAIGSHGVKVASAAK